MGKNRDETIDWNDERKVKWHTDLAERIWNENRVGKTSRYNEQLNSYKCENGMKIHCSFRMYSRVSG